MFHKDELFSNSNIHVDMVNLCSFFRGGGVFFGGGGANTCTVKKMFPFLVGFLIKLSTILTLAIHFSIFRKLFIPLFEEYDQQLNCIITMYLCF